MKDATLRAVDALVARLAEHDGADDFALADDMVRTAGLDVAYALATAALIGSARAKRRAATLETERRHQTDVGAAHEVAGAPRPRKGSKGYARWLRTPEGIEWEAAEREADERHGRKLAESFDRAISIYTREVRMVWDSELLDSTFALGDGTVVAWGAATIGQHEERAEMFRRNALANAEGYARHSQAIEDLRASGADTLREMVSVAA